MISSIGWTLAKDRAADEISGKPPCLDIVEMMDGEIFYSLPEAQIVIESWRRHYNTIRPHASLDYKPPAPEVFVPALAACPLRYVDQLRRPRQRPDQP